MTLQECEVAIRGIAAGGAGIGDLPDGRIVFVPRTAPGDRARIRLEKSRPRWARGRMVSLLEPGPGRVDAPCRHYGACGGCHLQHLPYEAQLEWKGRFVVDALERIAKIEDPPTPRVVPSPRRTEYRDRLTFTLRRLRGGQVVAGFHALGRPAHVVDIEDDCLLPRPAIAAAWRRLRSGWGPGASRLPAGGRLQLTLREGSRHDDRLNASRGGEDGDVEQLIDLVVRGGVAEWDPTDLVGAVSGLRAVWHQPSGTQRFRLLVGDVVGGGPTFAQVNPEAAELLRAHVVASVSGTPGRAVDAYAGTGEYGRTLAERGWTVTAIEVDTRAVAEARAEASREGLDGSAFEVLEGRVEDRLPEAPRADVLIVNPPRSGLSTAVTAWIGGGGPARVVYVSCDPATLARDLASLAGGYALEELRCFDLFPQTAHVETVATLRRVEEAS